MRSNDHVTMTYYDRHRRDRRPAPAERRPGRCTSTGHVGRRRARPDAAGAAPHRDARRLAELQFPGGPVRPAAAAPPTSWARRPWAARQRPTRSAAGCAGSTEPAHQATPTPAARTAWTIPSCCCGCTARRSRPTWRWPGAAGCGSPTARPTATCRAAPQRHLRRPARGGRAGLVRGDGGLLRSEVRSRAARSPRRPRDRTVPAVAQAAAGAAVAHAGQAGLFPVRRAVLLLAARLGQADVRHPARGAAGRGDGGAEVVPAGDELPARAAARPRVQPATREMLGPPGERLAAAGYDTGKGLRG